MTTDNAAHPAPTPAPVAVPEGGWCAGDIAIEVDGMQVAAWQHYSSGLWSAIGCGSVETSGIERRMNDGRIIAVHLAPRENTRPEPVVPCAGHATCNAPMHEHGCYNDYGSCDSPEEHRPEPVVAPDGCAEDCEQHASCRAAATPQRFNEPVAAPLPSEAVDLCPMHSDDPMHQAVRANRRLLGDEPQPCSCGDRRIADVLERHPRPWRVETERVDTESGEGGEPFIQDANGRVVGAAMLDENGEYDLTDLVVDAVNRLVPEDDEDTVRAVDALSTAREQIRARRIHFRELGTDDQYLNALDDAFGLVSNLWRSHGGEGR